MPKCGIYAIEHIASGKRYIGSSSDLGHRWSLHRRSLESGSHHCRYLQAAWLKHGSGAFRLVVLELVPAVVNLLEREQAWIDSTPDKLRYNSALVAGSTRGVKRSPEAIARHRDKMKGRIFTEEHRARLREAHVRVAYAPIPKPSAEAYRLMGERKRGYKHTDSTRAKMAASKLGRTQSAEHIAKRVTQPWRNAIARSRRRNGIPSFLSPDGVVWMAVENVKAFAMALGLPGRSANGLNSVWSGKNQSWHGWTAIRGETGSGALLREQAGKVVAR